MPEQLDAVDYSTIKGRFGRLPRKVGVQNPHLSSLLSQKLIVPGAKVGDTAPPPAPPPPVDYTKGMALDLGEFGNHDLQDCTCAAFYHARQVWTYCTTGSVPEDADKDWQTMYSEACGWNPSVPTSDAGGNIVDVLAYLYKTGAPTGEDGVARDKARAYAEIDHRDIDNIKRSISECGIVYIGFPVPSNVTTATPVWDYDPNATWTSEGHAVVLAGFDDDGAIAISWGFRYYLTWQFFIMIVDELYALFDTDWIEATGQSPAGMTLQQLDDFMQSLG
jgi:hypothetical protein